MFRTILIFLYIFLFLLILSVSKSRAQSSGYIPRTLIIKYEDDQTLSTIRSKQGSDPKARVREFLNSFGAREPQSIYPAGRQASLRKKRVGVRPSSISYNPAAELRRIHTIRYSSNIDPAYLAAKVSRLPGIEYAEPRYIRFMQETPSDTVENTYQNFHHFTEAWDETRGSPNVTVAIIDAGVAYNHPELDNKLWINVDEIPATVRSQVDQNGDERITGDELRQYLQDNGSDYNGDGGINLTDALHPDSPLTSGSDTDGNGFIDDLFGWDFWASGYTIDTITSDNNPHMDANDHGTHVAGIAAAETNTDSTGIAGTGHDISYMAIKAGGVPDDPGTSFDESNSVGFGFEGIIYAAENGADIINCSWGGGSFSQAEQDVIDFAGEMGALVVGAAGNQGAEAVIYPAAYPNVLGVGSVETNNRSSSYSNYGYPLDVLATGSNIQSIRCEDPNSITPGCNLIIGPKSGTSMATPVVSGLAGLLRSLYPDWAPQRIVTQIRATAVDIDGQNNLDLRHKLGRGKIDAAAAVDPGNANLPGMRILSYEFVNGQDEKLGIDEPGNINITLTNFGAATSGLGVNFSSLSGSGIVFSNPSSQVGTIARDDTVNVAIPVQITDAYNLTERPEMRLDLTDSPNYNDFDVLTYEDILFDTMDENLAKMSISADGAIGFSNPFTREGGIGFIPRVQNGEEFEDGANLLFEGGVIMEMNGEIHDAVRDSPLELSRDFDPKTTFRLQRPDNQNYLQGSTFFTTDTTNSIGAEIQLTSYAFNDPALSNVIYMHYEVKNTYAFFKLRNLYFGLFNDWDIGNNPGANSTFFNEQDSILYVSDDDPASTQPIVAVAHLGGLSSAFVIDNAAEEPGPNFGIYDEFSIAEKKIALKSGTGYTSKTGTDISTVIASGPYNINPGATASIGFIYAFGEDYEELGSQILEARNRVPFEVSKKGEVISEIKPEVTQIFQNYPNPFNPSTRIRLDLREPGDVNISIFNILGRKVAEIVNGQLDASIHIFNFNAASLSSGIYFARLKTPDRVETIKMVLVK